MTGGSSLPGAKAFAFIFILLLAAACGDEQVVGQASAAAGAGGSAAPAVAPGAIGDQVFDNTQVQSYYLTLSDTEYEKLMDFPWDLDKSFWYPEPNFWSDNAPNGQNVTPNWNVISRNCDGYTAWFDNLGKPYRMMAIDCDPLMRLLRGQIYAGQKLTTEQFIAGPFSESSVRAKVAAWREQIADAIQEDPLVDSARWQASVAALLADLPKFQSNSRLMMSGLIAE